MFTKSHKKDTPLKECLISTMLSEHPGDRSHRQIDAKPDRDDRKHQEYDEQRLSGTFPLPYDCHFHQTDCKQAGKQFEAVQHAVDAHRLNEYDDAAYHDDNIKKSCNNMGNFCILCIRIPRIFN